MINYTERIALVDGRCRPRTPSLSFIEPPEVLVFGRFGRSDAEGAFATCHCLTLPTSEPGYYFWRDRATGELTRRSEWFVTKSPTVRVGPTHDQVSDLVRAAAVLRSVARALAQSRALSGRADVGREARHDRARALSHRSRAVRPPPVSSAPTARDSARSHGPQFYEDVAAMVKAYLASRPDPGAVEFLRARLRRAERALRRRGGDDVQEFSVVSAALHGARASMPVDASRCADRAAQAADAAGLYTEDDLHIRQFTREQHPPSDPQGPAQRSVEPSVGSDLRLTATHC